MLQNCQPRRNFKSFRRGEFQAAGKASDGGNGREADHRAIVERHIGKHTGLRHSTKACPDGDAGDGNQRQGWWWRGPDLSNGATAPGARSARRSGREPMGVSFDKIDGVIWYDGKLVPWADANVHVLTHGLHYASAVFEGERAYGGRVFKSTAHSERLKNSANILDFEIPVFGRRDRRRQAARDRQEQPAGFLSSPDRLARFGDDGRGGARPTPFIWRSPPGTGRAISARPRS